MSSLHSSVSKPMAKVTPFIVQGSEQFGLSGKVQPIYYPADHVTQVGSCYEAEHFHLELIERAAEQGFQNFRDTPKSQRVAILDHLAALLEKHADSISRLITEETGKPITQSQAEVERTIHLCRSYAAELPRTVGTLMEVEQRQVRLDAFPVGPVLAITPYNFPLNLIMHKLAPAIATGCSITIKPAVQAPLTALYLGRLAIEAGYEAISVVPMSNELAEQLVQSKAFAKLSFTGSTAVGWKLRSLAGTKSVTLELGGNAALIIDELTLSATEMAQRVAFGAFAHAGQVCVSVQRLYVQDAIYDEFMDAFKLAARNMRVGDPLKRDTEVGPMISIEAVQRSRSLIKDALCSGANVVYGGNTYNTFTLNPTILDRTTADMLVNTEEAFAPIVTVTPYRDFEEAIALVNQSQYGLQAGLYTNDRQKIELAYRQLEVGGVVVNDIPTYRADLLPYGGIKASGLGREGVMAGLAEYSYLKTLVHLPLV